MEVIRALEEHVGFSECAWGCRAAPLTRAWSATKAPGGREKELSAWPCSPLLTNTPTLQAATRRQREEQRGVPMAVPLLLMVLALSALGGTGAVATFDSNNCNDTHPCCITADNVSVYMGPLTKTWCNIEYPVRVTFEWNLTNARILDAKAQKSLKALQERGCKYEECKGFVCAEYFPRCFYIDDSTQGAFVFETCKETCSECYASCKEDESPRCAANPSHYEIACTSQGSGLAANSLLLGLMASLCLAAARFY